jgi:uncharacterized protein
MKGTILNTGTVLVGSVLGLLIGNNLPNEAQEIAMSGMGLVTLGIGMKMLFGSKNILVVAASVAIGGILGLLIGIQNSLIHLADWVKSSVGGSGTFSEGLVGATVLFCIGPMTLLGCIQDRMEGKSDLLALKSTMDCVAGFFLAASLGVGVVFSTLSVFIIQGAITLMAKPLAGLKDDEDLLAELSGAGGVLMLAIGFSLLGIKKLPTANYLPALVIAPLIVLLGRKVVSIRTRATQS